MAWPWTGPNPTVAASTGTGSNTNAVRLPGVGVDLQANSGKCERVHGVLRSAQGAAVCYRLHRFKRLAQLLCWESPGPATVAAITVAGT